MDAGVRGSGARRGGGNAVRVAGGASDGPANSGPRTARGIVIDLEKPVAVAACRGADAYIAGDPSGRNLLALVTLPGVLPRLDAFAALFEALPTGILPLVEHDVVAWPDGPHRHVFVHEPLPGPSVAATPLIGAPRALAERVARPLAVTLRSLAGLGIAHRAIRPDNVFWKDAAASAVVLGPCVAVPPGSANPSLLEPAARAGAVPEARGAGAAADDVHALGVLLWSLAAGTNPGQEQASRGIEARLERGTPEVLLHGTDLPDSFADMVRGLTHDDPEERWTLDELDAWLDGRQVRRARAGRPRGGHRPFPIAGKPLSTPPAIAAELAARGPEGARLVRDGSLAHWLRNAAGDEETAAGLDEMVAEITGHDAPKIARPSAVLAMRTALLLDPAGPLRFGRLALMPDGLAPIAALALADGEVRDDFLGFLHTLSGHLLADCRTEGIDELRRRHGILKRVAASRTLGLGIERCLYELAPDLPCRHPRGRRPLARLADVAGMIDRHVQDGGEVWEVLSDRHVAAFLLARGGRSVERAFVKAAERSEPAVAVEELRLLGAVQRAAGGVPMPAVARAFCRRPDRLTMIYRSRPTRAKLEAALAAMNHEGDLTAILRRVSNPKALEADRRGFARAMASARDLDARIARLDRARAHGWPQAIAAARTGALTASVAVGVLVALGGLAVNLL